MCVYVVDVMIQKGKYEKEKELLGEWGRRKGGNRLDMKLKWNEGSWDEERDKGEEEARREDSKRKISKYKIHVKMP